MCVIAYCAILATVSDVKIVWNILSPKDKLGRLTENIINDRKNTGGVKQHLQIPSRYTGVRKLIFLLEQKAHHSKK